MNELEEKFYETGVVPVVVLEDAEDAVPLAQALVEGGLLGAEVTFRTAAAEESIRRMTEAFPQMLVGAGTVLTKEQVDAAAAAGAKFMPTGGINAGNLTEYLSCDKILCCGGSWMVKGDLVKAGNFGKIRGLSAETRKLVDTIRK